MLVVDGYFENGLFTPNNSFISLGGRQEAKLFIKQYNLKSGRRIKIKKLLPTGEDSMYDGEQERMLLNNPQNFEQDIEILR